MMKNTTPSKQYHCTIVRCIKGKLKNINIKVTHHHVLGVYLSAGGYILYNSFYWSCERSTAVGMDTS